MIAASSTEPPPVVTLRMGREAAARFTALRSARFPTHLNGLDAHVTLFHALPGAELAAVLADVRAAALAQAPLAMRCEHVRFLGAGVAFELASVEAVALQRRFEPRDVPAVGLDVWHCASGPWRAAASFAFSGEPEQAQHAPGLHG